MDDLKHQVTTEFRKLASQCGAMWNATDAFCEVSKNGISLRIRWSIERTAGVFVTLAKSCNPQQEYGLPYLVEFRGGDSRDMADASSDDLQKTTEVVRKYAMDFLDGTAQNFSAFITFSEERVRANTPPTPTIKANKTIRPEWI